MITETFNTGKPVFTPENLNGGKKDIPKIVIGFFETRYDKKIRELYSPSESFRLYTGHKIPTGTINYKGKEIGCFQSDIGGPATVALLENVFSRGAEKVLFFGSCGCLDKNIPKGHIIVPFSAYRDEGTSYHYVPASDFIDIPTAAELCKILEELHIPNIRVKTWTTDAIFRETETLAKRRLSEGCKTVEMECASVMAYARFKNKDVYQFLYTEDFLDDEYNTSTFEKSVSTTERILKTALETAIRL